MARRRHFPYRRLRRRARFNLAVLVTILVGRGYSPGYYEPKDHTRQEWILRHGLKPVPVVAPWQLALNIGLIFLVVVVWVSVLPGRR